MTTAACPSRGRLGVLARGFSLIEVLVALVIISVGMLGVAKIQALAYSSTGTASLRSLAAIQASGLAAAMHANRAYWAAGAAPVPITITGATITSSDATLATVANCLSGGANAPCTGHDLAAYDLQQWAANMNALLPNSVATITCPTASSPINCTVQLTWNEKIVAINTQGVNGPAMLAPTYTLYVEP